MILTCIISIVIGYGVGYFAPHIYYRIKERFNWYLFLFPLIKYTLVYNR